MLKFRSGILFIALFAVALLTVVAWAVYLPKTGQTTCYDVEGYEATCPPPGETSCNKLSGGAATTCPPNQDGNIKAGVAWPNPRFNDNGDGTITDSLTGLMWLKYGDCIGTGSWQNALNKVADFNVNPGSYACSGYTANFDDWRLPNINELESLFNSGFKKETCGAGSCSSTGAWLTARNFVDVRDYYWSSTTKTSDVSRAWYADIYYGYGNVSDVNKVDNNFYVLPVRGPVTTGAVQLPKTGQIISSDANISKKDDGAVQAGAAWPSPRFSATANTVTDNLTGLMWLRDSNCAATIPYDPDETGDGRMSWTNALDFVAAINDGGYSGCSAGYVGWRLPNRKELFSLFDYSQFNPALSPGIFSNVSNSYYWSSTTYTDPYDTEPYKYAFLTGLGLGNITYAYKFGFVAPNSYYYYVWPVRDTANISLSPTSLSFPDTHVGSTSAAQTFTIINSGTSDLTISSIGKLDDGTMFNVATGSGPNACPNLTPTLAPGGKCTMEVTFVPGLSCDRHASLDIQSNDPDAPHAYSALSGKGLVTLNVAINPPGGGTVTGSSITGANINCPGDCSEVYNTDVAGGVTLAPSFALTGYLFSGWTGCNSVTGFQCFITTEANKNVTAVFIKKSFIITISAGANGVITPGTTQVEYGANKAFDIIPDTGYRTKEVIVDGVSKGAAISVSFTNIIGDHSISAVFEAGNYLISSTAGSGGTVSCASANVAPGASSVCTATPDAGYKVLDFQADGVSKGKIVSFTFENVTNNHTVNVTFEKSANLKAVKAGKGNGDIVPSIPGQSCGPDCIGYVTGQRVTVMAKVESGSIYKGWTGCDSVSGNYCTVKMDKDKTVTANFEAAAPVISVSPEGPQDFGNVRVGRLRTRTLKITNNGTGNLRITSVEFDGEDEEMFSKRSGSAIIKPGKSSNLRVMFKPRSAGEKTASLMISSNDPAAPVVKISLTGSGISK